MLNSVYSNDPFPTVGHTHTPHTKQTNKKNSSLYLDNYSHSCLACLISFTINFLLKRFHEPDLHRVATTCSLTPVICCCLRCPAVAASVVTRDLPAMEPVDRPSVPIFLNSLLYWMALFLPMLSSSSASMAAQAWISHDFLANILFLLSLSW